MTINNRETGARKPTAKVQPDANERFSQDAAENKRPVDGIGLTESSDDTPDQKRDAQASKRARS